MSSFGRFILLVARATSRIASQGQAEGENFKAGSDGRFFMVEAEGLNGRYVQVPSEYLFFTTECECVAGVRESVEGWVIVGPSVVELVGVMALLELSDGINGVLSSGGGNKTGRSCRPYKCREFDPCSVVI